MARINDLLKQLDQVDAELAKEIQAEVKALSDRREFGLNFERHTPEQVELPGRPVRRGDKVHILPPRGETTKAENKVMWVVTSIDKTAEPPVASLEKLRGTSETKEVNIDDLVVVAEFRDPIYPGLVSTGKVERGGDKPFHTVINAENFHALEALMFTHRGKVDCIYIDPPYNTGARDWKYNNDYVESEDLYRHSKWLAFMERRLMLAKQLMNPEKSALIVTIDEKEYARVALLLEQIFPEAQIQMVSSVINRFGSSRRGLFSRVEEYLFYVLVGEQTIESWTDNMLHNEGVERTEIRWKDLRRGGENGKRSARPNLFYPIFVSKTSGFITRIGDSLPIEQNPVPLAETSDEIAVWPLSGSGEQMRWGLSADTLRDYLARGFVKWTDLKQSKTSPVNFYYLGALALKDLESGRLRVVGTDKHGSHVVEYQEARDLRPMTVWNRTSHSAGDHGSSLLNKLLPNRKFPFPKSLYAVEDALRFVVGTNPKAVILDFFAGSGTTTHAVMRLNKQDGGERISISITNNEVGDIEQKGLIAAHLRPGDATWDRLGICDFITKPRVTAAITGLAPEGDQILGDYKFTDEFPISQGFEENAEFFTLTYEDSLEVSAGRVFDRLAPLAWLRAGAMGPRIENLYNGWAIEKHYGILTDFDKSKEFLAALSESTTVTHVFVVSNEDRLFESFSREIPGSIECVRLYDSYLRNSEIEVLAVVR